MNFSEALDLVKANRFVAREGWNGKHMFIFLSFPHVQVYRKDDNGCMEIFEARKFFKCNYINPTICMKTADNKITVGWLASQTDMLSNDWIEINYPAKPDDLE
jgi:hypothetical protein